MDTASLTHVIVQFSTGFKEHIDNAKLKFLGEYSFNTDDSNALSLRVNELQVLTVITTLYVPTRDAVFVENFSSNSFPKHV